MREVCTGDEFHEREPFTWVGKNMRIVMLDYTDRDMKRSRVDVLLASRAAYCYNK